MTRFLGRQREMAILQKKVDDAISCRGSTVFIAGEAGIGKTRLAEECIEVASSKGFKILRGWCLNSCLTPYMPMRELLASGGMEQLITSETPPRLETVFLMTPTGILLSKFEREGSAIDSDIFAGMLTAVNSFIKDSIQQMGKLPDGDVSRLGHGSFNISAIHGKRATIASIYAGKENESLLNDMEQVLSEIEKEFGDRIEHFSGRIAEVSGTKDRLRSLFSSEKFEGIDWSRGDPRSKQNGIFENVTRGLLRESRKQPLLLFIDDLQWADPSSLALIHYLSRNSRGSRVMMLATYRVEDILEAWDGKTHSLTDTMQLMGREDLIEKIELKNLQKGEVAGIVAAILEAIEKEREFVEFIWNETQGNPLFVLEVINLLKDEGALACEDGVWRLTKRLESIDVPAKIHDVISRRLSRLLKEQRQLLESASVIGDVFSSDVLGKVTDIKRMDILRTLNEIERSHGLIVSMERKYAFAHVKIRDVLYNGLSKELKREYHRIVGDTMSELHGASEDAVADIGFHYYMAGDAKKAVPRLVRAIELAKGKYSNDETARYCSFILEMMEREPERWESEIAKGLEDMGDVKEISGKYDDSMASYARILGLSKDTETLARIHRKIAGIFILKGKFDEALGEAEKGRTLVEATGGPELGRILACKGSVYEQTSEYDNGIAMQDQALGILKRHQGTEKDVANVLHKIGLLYAGKGDYGTALAFYEKALSEFEKAGDLRGSGIALNSIGHILADRDRHDEALGTFERVLKTFEKLGEPRSIAIALNNLGIVYKSRCEYDKALANYDRCLEVFERVGNPRGVGSSLNNIGIVLFTRGHYKEALECYEKSLRIFERMNDKLSIAMMKMNIGLVHLQVGDYEKAREDLESSERIICELGNKRLLVDVWQGIGELMMRTGRASEAEEKLVKTIELCKQMGVKETEGISLRLIGMIKAEKGQWDDAVKEFEGSISVLGGAKIRTELAESYLEYGRSMKKRGDKVKAKETLNEALEMFEGMNLNHKADVVRTEME